MSVDELIYRRTFRAPRELVWRCLAEPGELAQFWGPSDMTTPLDGIVAELRAGGRFDTLMVGELKWWMVVTVVRFAPRCRKGSTFGGDE